MVGKLSPLTLSKYVFSRIGVKDPAVIVGPSIGEDSAIIDLHDGRVLVAHVDPITGAVELLGWLAVHISCNDVAVTGAKPRWLLSVLYFPEGADEELIDKITKQIDLAAKELGVMIVGGHSEYTPGLNRPLISMTALGIVDKEKAVKTGGAKAGDAILMTKSAAIEGTAILSTDFADQLLSKGVPHDIIKRGAEFVRKISVVKEAIMLAEKGYVTSMHDPTEGGILGGLTEIAFASDKTIEVWEEKIPVAEETEVMAKALNVDVLKLISSGVLIASVPKTLADEAVSLLRKHGIKASIIGLVHERKHGLVILHRKDGRKEVYNEVYVEDELVKLWKKFKR